MFERYDGAGRRKKRKWSAAEKKLAAAITVIVVVIVGSISFDVIADRLWPDHTNPFDREAATEVEDTDSEREQERHALVELGLDEELEVGQITFVNETGYVLGFDAELLAEDLEGFFEETDVDFEGDMVIAAVGAGEDELYYLSSDVEGADYMRAWREEGDEHFALSLVSDKDTWEEMLTQDASELPTQEELEAEAKEKDEKQDASEEQASDEDSETPSDAKEKE